MAKNTKNAGRKKKYQLDYPERAERYCARFGFTDELLAEEFGVAVDTIQLWKRTYPKFKRAVHTGKQMNSKMIEHNLRRVAVPHDEIQEMYELTGRGKNKKLTVVGKKVKKNVLNVNAALRILAADDPERYGNKLNLGGQDDSPLVVTDPAQRAEIHKIAQAIAAKQTADSAGGQDESD